MNIIPPQCATCGYWIPQNAVMGTCRRRAPIAIPVSASPGIPFQTVWPGTMATDFCAEHQPRPAPAKQPIPAAPVVP